MKPSLLAASFALIAAACGTTTKFVATNPPPHPMAPRPAAAVAVYTSVPNVPYVEVGIIQSRQSSEYSTDDMPEVIAAMRDEAASIGCDGIIIHGSSDKVVGGGNSDFSQVNTLEGFMGACIVYIDPPPAPAPAVAAPAPVAPAPAPAPAPAAPAPAAAATVTVGVGVSATPTP